MRTFMETLVPKNLVQTPTLQEAVLKTGQAVRDGTIIAFDGPPGLGKTSASAYACRENDGVSWRYLVLPLRRDANLVIRKIYASMFGEATDRLKLRQMERIIVERLAGGDLGLVTDEVQGAGLAGLQQVRYLHDEVFNRNGQGFPLILSGAGITGHVRKAPEVWGRIDSWTYFTPLDAQAQVDFARQIHPRLARTVDSRISRLSEITDGQTLRGWAKTAKLIDKLISTRLDPSAALSKTDVDTIEAMVH